MSRAPDFYQTAFEEALSALRASAPRLADPIRISIATSIALRIKRRLGDTNDRAENPEPR